MRRKKIKYLKLFLWKAVLFLFVLFPNCNRKRNDFDGKWKIIANGMLITSAKEEKEFLDSTCTDKYVEIHNSKIYGHFNCAYFAGRSILKIDSMVNLPLKNVNLNNNDRFFLTLEPFLDSTDFDQVKIYDLNVVNCSDREYLDYKYFFELKKDLCLVLTDTDYLIIKRKDGIFF